MLGIEFASFGRAARTLNHWSISLTTRHAFFENISVYSWLKPWLQSPRIQSTNIQAFCVYSWHMSFGSTDIGPFSFFIDSEMCTNSLVAIIHFLLPVHYNLSRWHHFLFINGFYIDNMPSMKRLWCFMCNTDNKNFLFWNRNTLGSVTSENWLKNMICALRFQPLSADVEE